MPAARWRNWCARGRLPGSLEVLEAIGVLDALGVRQCFAAVAGPSLEAVNEDKAATIAQALAAAGGSDGAGGFDRAGGADRAAVMVGDRSYDVAGATAHGIPTVDEYVGEYCRLTGRASLPDTNWYFAYNAFRLAGILQGIVGRVRDGTANSPLALERAARIPALAEMAWSFARKAGAK